MAASRDLPFPLAIMCLVLIRGSSTLPTTSGDARVNPRELSTGDPTLLSFEDYSQYEDTTVIPGTLSPHKGTLKRCDYKQCEENQKPCPELSATTGCLCPGFTSHSEAPEAPYLRSVSWNGSQVVIWWCAPASHVTSYIVTVGGLEKHGFRTDQRIGGLGTIDDTSEVCVIAVNEAGRSGGSCMMYEYQDHSLPLKAALIGGALGFLLLLLLAILLWRHKRQRKQNASISMHNTAATQ